jgi:hypothetical protein
MTRTSLFALALTVAFASGCSTLSVDTAGYKSSGTQPLKNAQGHVIGHKETLRHNGDRVTKIALYIPRVEDGKVVGYEELVPGGTVLRSLNGRKIGGRHIDLRSRGSNPNNRGLTIIVHSAPAAERVAATPDIDELRILARLN